VPGKDLLTSKSRLRTNVIGRPVSNKILVSIPDHEYDAIRPYLEYLTFPERYTLHEPHDKLRFAHFPNSGLISLLVVTEDGRTVEAGIVGNEGVAGIPIAAGITRSSLREVAVVSTNGFRVDARAMLDILKSTPQFQMKLNRYAIVQGMQIAQTVACNRLHHVERRLARWLLMAQDRVDSTSVNMTQDFLATILGTNRPTVSYAAAVLQKRKCIKCMRGTVKIVNRNRLEASACECYRVIQQFDRELGLR
jgi:CRP-like cAMP-binding protein